MNNLYIMSIEAYKNKPWFFYIIYNGCATYAGVSPDPIRRLRQHNGAIKGGAKYTISKGPGWKHICVISGFQDKIQAMQFEWAVKHVAPRNAGGITNRIKKLYEVLKRDHWTSKAPIASSVPLQIVWHADNPCKDIILPEYIS